MCKTRWNWAWCAAATTKLPAPMCCTASAAPRSARAKAARSRPQPPCCMCSMQACASRSIPRACKAAILAARTLIKKAPDYSSAPARLLLHTIVREVLGSDVPQAQMALAYGDYFPRFIKKGVDNGLLDERLLQYDLQRLGAAIRAERDLKFDYLGLQTLYDRYF